MKYHQLCFLVAVTFVFAGCDSAAPTKQAESEGSKSADSQPALAAASQAADFFLIDVRSQKEWDDGHLENAIHIPHTEIAEGIKKVTEDKSAKIYFY